MERQLAWHGICSIYIAPIIRKQVNSRLEGSIYVTCMKRVYAQLKYIHDVTLRI